MTYRAIICNFNNSRLLRFKWEVYGGIDLQAGDLAVHGTLQNDVGQNIVSSVDTIKAFSGSEVSLDNTENTYMISDTKIIK